MAQQESGILYDTIITGGSYAGLSAAMALGRSLRRTLIIDSGQPCNRFTPFSHNLITHDGESPFSIREAARLDVAKYDMVNFYEGLAISGKKIENHFEIRTLAGDAFLGKKLLFATGITDMLPDHIPGFAACWGKSVIHCPYCHGYEFRGRNTAILANGEKAVHLARLVKQLTNELTIITSGEAEFDLSQMEILRKNKIKIMEASLARIDHDNGHMHQVFFSNGQTARFDALYAVLPFRQGCDMPIALGCQVNESGHLQTDHLQQTTVQGIFAAGDCVHPMRSVAQAIAGGNMAGAAINYHLASEEF